MLGQPPAMSNLRWPFRIWSIGPLSDLEFWTRRLCLVCTMKWANRASTQNSSNTAKPSTGVQLIQLHACMPWQKKKKTALLTASVLHSASICLDRKRVPAKVEHALIPSRTQSTGHRTALVLPSAASPPSRLTTPLPDVKRYYSLVRLR